MVKQQRLSLTDFQRRFSTEAPENNSARFSDSGYLSIRKLRPRVYDVLVARETRVIARSSPHPFGSLSVDVSDSNRWQDCKSASVLEY